ncbi:MAG: DUF2110 family protein, partial [Candidatus Heimdallarchaeota archaeon]
KVKKVLTKTNHIRDIISLERYGFLESIVMLKKGTEAPGIISEIGKYLVNSKISVIRAERIKNLFGE